MPVSIVLVLRPREKCQVPATLGKHVHAAFLSLIENVDANLATELHSGQEPKPFTVSPLQGRFSRVGDRHFVDPTQPYWLRFTGLDQRTAEALQSPDLGQVETIRLAEAEFKVSGICRQPDEHPWANHTDYEDLYNRWVAIRTGLPNRVAMQFYSPTAFRSNGQTVPLPQPDLVFFQLVKKWNRWSPVFLGAKISEMAARRVVPSRFQLRTRMMDFGDYRYVGFVGTCEFYLGGAELLTRVIHLLADFAFYSGIGYKTPMGMGQARKISDFSTR